MRNENDFNDWKIEGHCFDYLNVPYFDLLDGVEGILEKVPSDKEVLVVCAKEGSSVMVSKCFLKQVILYPILRVE